MHFSSRFLAVTFISFNLFVLGCAYAGETLVFSDDFQSSASKKNWSWHGEFQEGVMILTSPVNTKWGGAQALFNHKIDIGADNQNATHIHLKINKIGEADGKPVNAIVKIFLIADPLKSATFADSYSEPNALTLMVTAVDDQGTAKVQLYKKIAIKDPGYGEMLYSSSVPLQDFPLDVDWYISRSGYSIKLGGQAQSLDGSRQGSYSLGAPFDSPMRLVMRVVNFASEVKSQMSLSDFTITTGPIPE